MSYFGTTDVCEIEKRIAEGDGYAEFIYNALVLNICKNISKLAPVVSGNINVIILTGGMAHSKLLTAKIAEHVAFISPISVIPGENEMQALSQGVMRVLRGEEVAHVFGE